METALILCRLVQFAAAMLLWGAGSLRAGAFPPALLRASRPAAGRLGRLVAAANLLAALGWLAVEAAMVGNGPQDAVSLHVLSVLLTSTRFGQVWAVHLMIAVLLLLATFTERPKWVAVLAGLNLGTLALTGHAVLPGGALGMVHQGLSVLHLLAAGFWVGGLAVILPLLMGPRDSAPVLRHFSRWGHLAVALVLATGLAKSVLILTARGGFDPAPEYLALLAAKAAAVLLMVGLALVNRYRYVPRLTADPAALRSLRRGTLAELVLTLVVLGLVSVFATMSPFADV